MTLALALLLALASAGSAEPDRWHETLSPHFIIKHETAFGPQGLTLDLEKLHNRLRLDLSMFAPWMAKERISLFLYATQSSYLHGRFTPPSWSNGVAFYQDRTVATFVNDDKRKMMQVLGHETTHLLFEGYWGEVGKAPPVWLNEGLAMMEETDEEGNKRSDWRRALDSTDARDMLSLARLTAASPTKDFKDDRAAVTGWYVESYGLVNFLYHFRQRMQFFNFCAQLRDGRPLEDVLWRVYRLHGLGALEREFHASLGHHAVGVRRGVSAPKPEARPSAKGLPRTLKNVSFHDIGFKGLVPEEKKRQP